MSKDRKMGRRDFLKISTAATGGLVVYLCYSLQLTGQGQPNPTFTNYRAAISLL